MVRPKRLRRVGFRENFHYFKPRGIGLRDLEEVCLTVDEFEALRLKDKEQLDQVKAAKQLNVSQPTFHRILDSARKKIAEAIVDGKAIKIQGGTYKMPNKDGTGPNGEGPRTGRGMGKCPPEEGEINAPQGRGLGRGLGRGQGRGRR